MFVLRSSISVQVSKKIFGITNKQEVQISILGVGKKFKNKQAGETFIWHSRVIKVIDHNEYYFYMLRNFLTMHHE